MICIVTKRSLLFHELFFYIVIFTRFPSGPVKTENFTFSNVSKVLAWINKTSSKLPRIHRL